MTGVLRGGASEQAPRSKVSAGPAHRAHLSLFISTLPLANASIDGRRTGEAYFGAGDDSIGRVSDHTVIRGETRGDLDHRTWR
jgi:hypothetical protein